MTVVNQILGGTAHLLNDAAVQLVLERIYTEAQVLADEVNTEWTSPEQLTDDKLGDFGFSLRPAQGELMYLLCRAHRPKVVVDFATSAGASTIYLATALRDNGTGGQVISVDWRPERIAVAEANLKAAGLSEYVELRCGEPADVLDDLPGPIDFMWVDGWPQLSPPSRAQRVVSHLAARFRSGAMVLNDAREIDYVQYMRRKDGPFRTSLLDIGVLSIRE
ncbi:MAG: class I SAM-dependent methyltransferase [Mycolicibacterium frederiksbergense]|nr:class I SAM-dependent methyltransferase [Mycolicibacterium frederiksbergense]